MNHAREFYRLIWDDVQAQNSITQGNDPDDPWFEASIVVTEENQEILTEIEQYTVANLVGEIEIEIGNEVRLKRGIGCSGGQRVFFNHRQLVKSGEFECVRDNDFYIGDINFDSLLKSPSISEPNEVVALRVVAEVDEILTLVKNYQSHTARGFVSIDTLETPISIEVSSYSSSLVQQISSIAQDNSFMAFSNWIHSEENENHQIQKLAIVRARLFDLLSNEPFNDRLIKLLSLLPEFSERCLKSYALYIEEFSYSRFTKKIQEKSVE